MGHYVELKLSDNVWIFTYEGPITGWEIRGDKYGFNLTSEKHTFRCLISHLKGTDKFHVSMVHISGRLPVVNHSFTADVSTYRSTIEANIMGDLVPRRELFLEEIKNGNYGKGELTELLGFKERFDTWDYALPQTWLDQFSKWIETMDVNNKWWARNLDYHKILGTTVYAYGKEAKTGQAVSCCFEVNHALKEYNR